MIQFGFGIPKKITVDRGAGDEEAMSISQVYERGGTNQTIGLDGGLTLKEAEDLLWRLKQGIHLLKHGRILKSRP